MFKYTIGVVIEGHEFFLTTNHEASALTIFDSIVESTDNVMEGEYLSVPAKATVSTVSLRRTFIPIILGDPNQVSY